MSGIMDPTPTLTLSPCASCHRELKIMVCYCEMEVCESCAGGHLALCAYANGRRFRTTPKNWREA
jgi:hypothetical protein